MSLIVSCISLIEIRHVYEINFMQYKTNTKSFCSEEEIIIVEPFLIYINL